MMAAGAFASPPGKPAPPRRAPVYGAMVRAWHAPPEAATPDGSGLRLVLQALNTTDRIELVAAGPRGGFAASDLDQAARMIRDLGSGAMHPVEPLLLDALFRVQAHFAAPEVRVLSGYRLPRRGGASNHGRGRAIDFVLPGVPDADVAAFARTLGFVGVGIYPASGFVHLDVRDRSYFWTDASGPGRRNRERGILGDLARTMDAEATRRGEVRVGPYFVHPDVDVALAARAPSEVTPDDDDDTGD